GSASPVRRVGAGSAKLRIVARSSPPVRPVPPRDDSRGTPVPPHQPLVMISLRCGDGGIIPQVEGTGIRLAPHRFIRTCNRPLHHASRGPPPPRCGGGDPTAQSAFLSREAGEGNRR